MDFLSLKATVRLHKFNFDAVVDKLNSQEGEGVSRDSYSADEVRQAYASKSGLSKVKSDKPKFGDGMSVIQPTIAPPLPVSFNASDPFEFDVEEEMELAEREMSAKMDEPLGTKLKSGGTTPARKSSACHLWDTKKWEKDMELMEMRHTERNEAAFNKALSALGGVDSYVGDFDLNTLPPEIAAAVQSRRDRELMERMEKRGRKEKERVRVELSQQRERCDDVKKVPNFCMILIALFAILRSPPPSQFFIHVAS